MLKFNKLSVSDSSIVYNVIDEYIYTTEKLVYDKKNETVKYFNKQGKEFESNTLDDPVINSV